MVSILQFNVLADHLSDAFPLVDGECLKWENRKSLILDHIMRRNPEAKLQGKESPEAKLQGKESPEAKLQGKESPEAKLQGKESPDIICLEEVDHFIDWFQPELAAFGYTGHFITKKTDGCALFFKNLKLRAGSAGIRLIKLSDYLPAPFNKTSQQVAIVAHLVDNDFKDLVIGITHLKAKYGFDEMRLAQMKIMCEKVNEIKEHVGENCGILLAGDFNADPGSNVVNFVNQQLTSSFPLNNPSFFTTWKIRPPEENKRVIDYIFHSSNLSCVDTFYPNDESLIPYPRLPSSIFPSDHLPIYSKFEWVT